MPYTDLLRRAVAQSLAAGPSSAANPCRAFTYTRKGDFPGYARRSPRLYCGARRQRSEVKGHKRRLTKLRCYFCEFGFGMGWGGSVERPGRLFIGEQKPLGGGAARPYSVRHDSCWHRLRRRSEERRVGEEG